jgi:serine/threonine protein kinase
MSEVVGVVVGLAVGIGSAVALIAGLMAIEKRSLSQSGTPEKKNKFITHKIVGGGSFGMVYEGSDTKSENKYAFKFILLQSDKVLQREMIPGQLKHKNIIEIHINLSSQ